MNGNIQKHYIDYTVNNKMTIYEIIENLQNLPDEIKDCDILLEVSGYEVEGKLKQIDTYCKFGQDGFVKLFLKT